MRRADLVKLGSVLACFVALMSGCGSDEATTSLFQMLIERKTVEVGGGGDVQLVRLGSGAQTVELEVPGNVVRQRAMAQVSLVSNVTKRGRTPVNDLGVLVEPAGLTFDEPVRVRQRVPAPPVGMTYVTVVVPDGKRDFEARTPARRRAPAESAADPRELWEGDGTGSGLWGLALQ